METTNVRANDAPCCIDYCQIAFDASGKEVVNRYKCNQQSFTAAKMWNIRRSKRGRSTQNSLQHVI